MIQRLIRLADRSRATAIALGAVFLFAQAVVLDHKLDPDAYDAGHTCDICIPGSVLGGGNVASAAELEFAAPDRSVEYVADVPVVSRAPLTAYARGPPSVS